MGDSVAATNDYVSKLFQTMLNPSMSSTPNGQLRSCSNSNSQIYVMQGCVTLTTEETATKVVIMLDPEPSFRNGQAKAIAYQYSPANVLIKMSDIMISAPSDSFAYGAVLSARLDVTNFSSQINIAGGMTGSVLNSIPNGIMQITQSQLKQRTAPLDYVSAEMSHDGISLFSITSHVGSKNRSLLDGFSSSSGWMYNYVSSATTLHDGWNMGNTALSSGNVVVWDSYNLESNMPFTIATFAGKVEVDAVISQVTTVLENVSTWRLEIFDAVGNAMFSSTRKQINRNTVAGESGELKLSFQFSGLGHAVHRIKLICITAMANSTIAAFSNLMLRGLEDIEDIPDRDLMVIVCEGINPKASLSIDAVVVVSAAPSSDLTFIAGGSDREGAGADIRVHNMLTHIHKQLPRAHKRSEAAVFAEAMRVIQSSKLHSDVMHAWSMPNFHKIGRTIASTAGHVRHGVRHAHQLMEQAQPYLQQVHDLAEQHRGVGGKLGTFIGKVSDITGAADKYSQQARQYTQHASSEHYSAGEHEGHQY